MGHSARARPAGRNMMGTMKEPGSYSRRTFLGLTAAGAAGAAAGCSAGAQKAASASGKSHPPASTRPVSENALPGDPNWQISKLGAPMAIAGYAGRSSVLPGEPVTLYVSTTARSFRVLAFRMGWYGGARARLVWQSAAVRGRRQGAPRLIQPTNTVECDWGESLTVPTHDWPEGSYLFRLDAESGAQRFIPLTVRSASTAGKVVIKNGVETWQAYNTWGGYDLYNGPGGTADYSNRSLAVSLDRPYDANGAFMFLYHERKLVELAERAGLPLAYETSMDIEADPHLLTGASALICPGHDEYWSPPERANVTAARDAGVNVAFMGANTLFRRTRLASTRLGPRRLVICYKTSYPQDPMYGKDNALVTSDWREPPNPDPESPLTGVLYESNPADAAYVIASPHSWVYAGTGVAKGTRFTGLVGIEYDRVNPVYPVQRPIEVLSHSPLTCRGVNSYSDSAYYTHAGGAGVFAAGTMRWVATSNGLHLFGLNRRAWAFTQKVTLNVMHAFADGPAAHKYPAQDNLDAMHEWPGDPIAAQHDLWPPVTL
jgi:N,N-dimethylformamidase beta subunit-like, C-terminal